MVNRDGRALAVIFDSVLFDAVVCTGSLGYRSDRINHARNAMMSCVCIRDSWQWMCIYVEGLIEASSLSLICAACMRSDWDISRVTVDVSNA